MDDIVTMPIYTNNRINIAKSSTNLILGSTLTIATSIHRKLFLYFIPHTVARERLRDDFKRVTSVANGPVERLHRHLSEPLHGQLWALVDAGLRIEH